MAITQREMTLEEFLELPERKPALEYEDGRITQKVPPKGRHSALQSGITQLFNEFGRPSRRAWALTELRVTLDGVSRVPDVAVYLWERLPRDERGRIADDFREPPDIVAEVASPRQSVNELNRRCLWFVEHGTRVALLIDPADESVARLVAGKPTLVLRGADRIDLDAVLPGFQLTVQQLFDTLLV